MVNLFKSFLTKSPEPKELTPKAWLINPVTESITEIDNPHMPSLIAEIGDDAEAYKLDNLGNVAWMTETASNKRYAYWYEGMDWPFSEKHYSKGLIECMGPNPWDLETINDWLRFFDKKNIFGDV